MAARKDIVDDFGSEIDLTHYSEKQVSIAGVEGIRYSYFKNKAGMPLY